LEDKGSRLAQAGKDWIFVSDAHFTGRDPERMETFLRFLRSEEERIDHLVILGDLFEFFFGFKERSSPPKPFSFPEYLPILEELQHLYHQGICIKYFEGNHDFFLHSFFSQQLGIDVEVYNTEGNEERLGGKRTFIAHGDLSNSRQWKYRIFRSILKNQWTYSVIQLAGPHLSRRIAKKLSDMSFQKYHTDTDSGPPPAFKDFAQRKFLEGYEIVILGHSHFPEEVEEWTHGRRSLYFNAGDWMIHRSFLRFTPPDRFELDRFTD
jgi:UDP-2,3-diacylglucosamine hydrolase